MKKCDNFLDNDRILQVRIDRIFDVIEKGFEAGITIALG